MIRTFVKSFLFACALGLYSSVVAAAHSLPVVGDIIAENLMVNTDEGFRLIPLPAGNWSVVFVSEKQSVIHRHKDLSPSDLFSKIVLVQILGVNLRHYLVVDMNTTFQMRDSFSNDLCMDKGPKYFRD